MATPLCFNHFYAVIKPIVYASVPVKNATQLLPVCTPCQYVAYIKRTAMYPCVTRNFVPQIPRHVL